MSVPVTESVGEEGQEGRAPRLALGLGQGAGLQHRAPKSGRLSPGQRAEARLLHGPLPDTEEAGLGSCHGSFFGLWNSRRGQFRPGWVPSQGGHCWRRTWHPGNWTK